MNCIEKGKIYYHHELRILPKAPSCTFDDDGRAVWKESKFILQFKESYTEEDLLAYFIKMTKHELIDKGSEIRSLKYFVSQYGIDLVLFAIDELAQDLDEGNKLPPRSAYESIKQHFTRAKESLIRKEAFDKEYGIIK